MKVLIVGGDIPALVCAIACRRENVDVVVLEDDIDVEVTTHPTSKQAAEIHFDMLHSDLVNTV